MLGLFVVARVDRYDLPAPILAALGARPMRFGHLPTVGALHQLGNRQILVAAAIAAAVTGYFALRYGTHGSKYSLDRQETLLLRWA